MIGLRLQGINVLRVVVQVGEGTCLALLDLRSVEAISVRVEENSRNHTEPQSCCGYREEMHDVCMMRGSKAGLGQGCNGELGVERWRQEEFSQDQESVFVAEGRCEVQSPGSEKARLVSPPQRSRTLTMRGELALEPWQRNFGPITT